MNFKRKKALLLDLDGTVRKSRSGKKYIQNDKDVMLYDPRLPAILQDFKARDWLVLGVSNQGGVAHGFRTITQIESEMDATRALFPPHTFDDIVYAPAKECWGYNLYNFRSLLRKPHYGMLALLEHKFFTERLTIIDWKESIMVGDMDTDKECADGAKITFLFIRDFLNLFKHKANE